MKRIFLSIFAIMSFIDMKAEETDMLVGNQQWDFSSFYATGEYLSTEPTYKIDDKNMGVMEKNGRLYHKIYLLEQLHEDSSEGGMYVLAEPFVGIRETKGKVYVDYESYMALTKEERVGAEGELPFHVTEDGEILLYDYTVGVGDRYPTSDVCAPLFVSIVETVTTIDGVQRKLITLDNGLQLLEGIGCLNSNGLLLHYLYTSGHWFQDYQGSSITHNLCEYYKDGEPVYIAAGHDMAGIVVKQACRQQTVSIAYDLQGRQLQGRPAKGLYIENGRKRVVK